MNDIQRPVAIGFSPNLGSDDVRIARKILLHPFSWKNGTYIRELTAYFRKRFGGVCYPFASGRAALYYILKAFSIGRGDEVIIQPYSCIAVPNAVIWTGARPVYADIDDTLNIDYRLIGKLITNRTKAIIVQHTFGIGANMKEIRQIARKHGIILIEDCAHALGTRINSKPAGTWGDAAMFSFGRDKVVSGVFGGIACIHTQCRTATEKMEGLYRNVSAPPVYWILQQLLHPLLTSIILPVYHLKTGKALLAFFQKLRLLSFPVYRMEKRTEAPRVLLGRLPNAMAGLVLHQLQKLEEMNGERERIARYYFSRLKIKPECLPPKIKGSVYLRFNILSENASRIRQYAKMNKIILGNWYHNVIDPEGSDFRKIYFSPGRYPRSSHAAHASVNLPTYPHLTKQQLDCIIDIVNRHAKT